MAARLDYIDELGRRKVYAVTRAFPSILLSHYLANLDATPHVGSLLAHPGLPPGLIPYGVDVLLGLPTERKLVRVVVEFVMELREGEVEDEEDVCLSPPLPAPSR
jgi:hypothetical protein